MRKAELVGSPPEMIRQRGTLWRTIKINVSTPSEPERPSSHWQACILCKYNGQPRLGLAMMKWPKDYVSQMKIYNLRLGGMTRSKGAQ